MKKFIDNLIENLKVKTINELLIYSLNSWKDYIYQNGLLDKGVIEFLADEDNKKALKDYTSEKGIIEIKCLQNKVNKRYIIGFDSYLSIRKYSDISFKDYFEEYSEYLKNIDINDVLKLKVILYAIADTVKLVPKLAMFDTMVNAGRGVGYNIRYTNKEIGENIYVNIRGTIKGSLEILKTNREKADFKLIEDEIYDLYDILSKGLFGLIVNDNYPSTLENILPKEIYKAQIEDRILKDEVEVKYEGKVYRAIELRDSYLALDSELISEIDQKKAKAIYCKTSLSKSFLL